MNDERTKTAYHESGHAAVATYFGWQVTRLTIEPNPKERGSCLHKMPPEPLSATDCEIDGCIALSGFLAEQMYCNGGRAGVERIVLSSVNEKFEHAVAHTNDYQRARRRAASISPLHVDDRVVSMAFCAAGILTGEHAWQNVERLAKALLTAETLFAVDVELVLAGYRPNVRKIA